jgi:O-acetyl-ADP-ribose deacetylase (regulator of RNase III)
MIEFVKGNLFEANVDALVNTVNTVGVMGKGIALQFSRAFPEIMKPYKAACKAGELEVGTVQTIELKLLDGPKYIINFPTKKHWKGNSKIEFIQSGLKSLVSEIERLGIKSIAIPPLGCGLGGLKWTDVKSEIELATEALSDVKIVVYEPAGKPAASKMKTATKKPNMSPGRAALLGLMKRYVSALMDDAVTLLELHKLMYFLKESGEVPKLKFVKGRYGPYSTNLRHVLTDLEGHYITGFGDASEEPGKVLEPMEGAVDQAETYLESKRDTLDCLNRVGDLIDGFETAYGMELLASVHWVATNDDKQATSKEEAVEYVHAWNPRKKNTFAEKHIYVAWDRLTQTGLMGAKK